MSWVPLPWCTSQSTISTRSPARGERGGGDGDVVEQAEALATCAGRVVARRPDDDERGVALAALERVHGVEAAAGGRGWRAAYEPGATTVSASR